MPQCQIEFSNFVKVGGLQMSTKRGCKYYRFLSLKTKITNVNVIDGFATSQQKIKCMTKDV